MKAHQCGLTDLPPWKLALYSAFIALGASIIQSILGQFIK